MARIEPPLSNRQIAELLARTAETSSGNAERALRRASRRALSWPVEAADLRAADRSLTQLVAVGPYLARRIGEWLHDPPDLLPPPAAREGFLSYAEARTVVAAHPEWEGGLRADLQLHTTYTDGGASVAEMVAAATSIGHAFVALTDHSQGLRIAKGIDAAGFARQDREIARVLERGDRTFDVLRGVELNVAPDGSGDMDGPFLADRDLVLGAFHSQLRRTDDQTERYLRALENPAIDVHAHPRGRIWNVRLGLQADWERVARRAAALGKALEVDAYPDRQDLDVERLRLVAQCGGTVSIGTDAHSAGDLQVIWIGVAAAILAGLRREQVLNYREASAVRAWVRERRGH